MFKVLFVVLAIAALAAARPQGQHGHGQHGQMDAHHMIPAFLNKIAQHKTMMPQKDALSVGSISCDGCKLGFWLLEEIVQANLTESAISDILGDLCLLFKDDAEKAACKDVVAAGVKELLDLVTKVETPDEICHQIGVCWGPAPTPNAPCAICEFVMQDVQRWLSENRTIPEIEHLIDSLCLLLPDSSQALCKKITDIGIADLAELIEGKTPTEACESILICPTNTECLTCDIIFTALEDWADSNKTIAEIDKLLDNLCNLLPDRDRQICDNVVKVGIKEALDLLKEKESPYEACREIGLCEGPAPTREPCHECKYILANVVDWVNDGLTVKEIDTELADLCELLGTDYTPVCDKLANVGADKLVEELKTETPEQICTELGICTK